MDIGSDSLKRNKCHYFTKSTKVGSLREGNKGRDLYWNINAFAWIEVGHLL